LSASVAGQVLPPEKMNWNRLLDEGDRPRAAKVKNVKLLSQYIIIKHVVGKKEDHGFRYLANAASPYRGRIQRGRGKRHRIS